MLKGSFPDLSPSYKRNILTTLSFLDQTMMEFEELARGRERRSVLYAESNELASEQRRLLLSEVGEIRRILVELRTVLDLDVQARSATRFIWSQCSVLWANLSEVDSRRLKGYGEAPAGFAEYWDPKISELEGHLDRILESLKMG